MIIKRNFWQKGEKFSEKKMVFLQVSEKYSEQVVEKTEKKSDFTKEDYEDVSKRIFGDSEKTKKILEKNFKNFEDRLFLNNGQDFSLFKDESFKGTDVYTEFSDKIGSLKNSFSSKIGILSEGNNKEYERLSFQEKQIELTLDNLIKTRDKKINSLKNSQDALNSLNNMSGIINRSINKLNISQKLDQRNAKKEIERLDKIEKNLNKKVDKIAEQKEKIEGRFEKKMGKVDSLSENISGVLEGFDLTEDENEYFIQGLKEGKIDSSFGGLKLVRGHEKGKLSKILEKINLNKTSSDLSKNILEKSVKEFNKRNIKQFENFSKIKGRMDYYEDNKDEFENIAKNTEKFEEFIKEDSLKILKDQKFEMNGKKFEGNFEINKTKKGELYFIETNKVGSLDSSCEWGEDSVVVFDKERGFIEVDDEFLNNKENKDISENISEKLNLIKDSFEDQIGKNLKDKEKREEFLEGYKKFASKYKSVFKEFKVFNGAFEKIERAENKKDVENKKEELEKMQDEIIKKMGIDLKDSVNNDKYKNNGKTYFSIGGKKHVVENSKLKTGYTGTYNG